MREKGSAKSRTINEGAVATPRQEKGLAKSRTINVHSCPMYRHLLGLLCGLDSFVTSRIPVFSKRIDFFKVGIDNELLDPLFSFEEVSEEAEPLGQHNKEESPPFRESRSQTLIQEQKKKQ